MFKKLLLTLLFVGSNCIAEQPKAFELAKDNGCIRCHSIDHKKKAISFKDIAAKYKKDDSAHQKLMHHLTSDADIELDGEFRVHRTMDASNDLNLVINWILSQ